MGYAPPPPPKLVRAGQSGYPARDGRLYRSVIDYCIIEVREGYAAGEFEPDELERRAYAAVRGDVAEALPDSPFPLSFPLERRG